MALKPQDGLAGMNSAVLSRWLAAQVGQVDDLHLCTFALGAAYAPPMLTSLSIIAIFQDDWFVRMTRSSSSVLSSSLDSFPFPNAQNLQQRSNNRVQTMMLAKIRKTTATVLHLSSELSASPVVS